MWKMLLVIGFLWLSYENQPLTVSVYMEAQNTDCNNFIQDSIKKTLLIPDIDKILKLDFIPYGDTQVIEEPPFYLCHHSKIGCYGNNLEACGFTCLQEEQSVLVKWLVCMESERYYTQTQYDQAHTICGKDLPKYVSLLIHDCANEGGVYICNKLIQVPQQRETFGHNVQQMMQMLTTELNPPHTYLPWITVNDKHDVTQEKEIIADIVKWACNTYEGDSKPKGCNDYLN